MNKKFDAVEVMRKVRDDIYEQTKDMSSAELIDFFRRRGSTVKERLDELRELARQEDQ